MCIRDRSEKAALLALANELAAQRDDLKVQYDAAIAQIQACLLYTSDAADERSSVDLGGRRIIKKKKTEDDQGPPRNKEQKNIAIGTRHDNNQKPSKKDTRK